MSSTLPLLWSLSSAKRADRIEASVKLVSALEQFQSDFIAEASAKSNNALEEDQRNSKRDSIDIIDATNSQDVSYSLRRLIRGLASPRESSRLGFAVALTELLSRINTVTCIQVLNLIESTSETTGSMSGQEERDILFARLFGIMAVIQSGLLTRQTPLHNSSNLPSSVEGFQKLIQELLALGEKKSFLLESSSWAILQATEKLHSSEVSWKDEALELLIGHLFKSEVIWTPEMVAVALKLQSMYPTRDWSKCFSPTFKGDDILHTRNLANLGKILKDAPDVDEEKINVKQNSGFWKPQLHFVWDIIFDKLLLADQNAGSGFENFFRVVVDDTLFAANSSTERKYWGFQVFRKALQRLQPSQVSFIFTPNFMRTWINHLPHNDRYLHKIAKQVAVDIQELVANNPNIGFTVILQITGAGGNRHFDRITKTKTVESILSTMDDEGIKTYTSHLLSQLNTKEEAEGDTDPSIHARRIWIIEQLAVLLRNPSIPQKDEWMLPILHYFATYAYFNVIKKSKKSANDALHVVPNPPLTPDFRELCKTKLLASLADLAGRVTYSKRADEESQSRSSRTMGVAEDGEYWLVKVLFITDNLEKDKKHAQLVSDDESGLRDLNEVVDLVKKLSQTSDEVFKGAELILAALALKQYNTADTDDESLRACIDACKDLLTSMSKSKEKKSKDASEGDPSPVDVLVDIIIGLLEESSAFSRVISTQAFALLTSGISKITLDLIIAQLENRDVGNASEDDESSDIIIVGKAKDKDESDEDDDEDSSGSAEEDSDEYESAAEDEELEIKSSTAGRIDGESDDSEDEEVMDDDQMMKIDEQLTAIFRSRKEEKKAKNSNAQREAIHFKLRVLDLIDTYLRKESANVIVLQTILPLIQLISGASKDEKHLSEKASGIIRTRLSKFKDMPVLSDTENTIELLKSLHSRARKASTQHLSTVISQCSLYVSKLLSNSGSEAYIEHYKESVVDFATRKASLVHSAFISDFLKRFPDASFKLRTTLVDLAPKAINVYRQCQIFNFLQILLCQTNPANVSSESHYADTLSMVLLKTQEVLADACKKESKGMATTQVKDLLTYCLQIARHAKKTFPKSLLKEQDLDVSMWDDLAQSLSHSDKYENAASLQNLCKQLSSLVRELVSASASGDGEQSAQGKRKTTDEAPTQAAPKKRRIKRSKASRLE